MQILKIDERSKRKGTLVWIGTINAILLMFLCFFPTMQSSGFKDLFTTKMDALPSEMLKAFNLDTFTDFTDFIQYYGYVFQYIALAAGIYAFLLGANALIKEESEGTIEFLYAFPFTRMQIVFEKYVSAVLNFTVFTASIYIVSAGGAFFLLSEGASLSDTLYQLFQVVIGMYLIGMMLLSVGFALSTILKSVKLVSPVSLGIVFCSFLFGIFAKLIESLDFLKYVAVFDYFPVNEITKNGFDMMNISIVIIIMVLGIAFALYRYNKKDMRI